MHALPLLAILVDPYEILFRRPAPRPGAVGLGDEPNPEARLFLALARRRPPFKGVSTGHAESRHLRAGIT
jgi:hypothetical protein